MFGGGGGFAFIFSGQDFYLTERPLLVHVESRDFFCISKWDLMTIFYAIFITASIETSVLQYVAFCKSQLMDSSSSLAPLFIR